MSSPGRRQPPRGRLLAGALGLMASTGACFDGEFLVGTACSEDADCGPTLDCISGLCRESAPEPLVLGMSAVTSGPNERLGIDMSTGIRAYFHHVNANGGVYGRELQLEVLDDGYEPDAALLNVQDLLGRTDPPILALIGNVGTPTAAVTVPYLNEQRFMLFGAFTGAGLLRLDPPDRYIFNFRPGYAQETAAMVDYLLDRREPRTVSPVNVGVFAQGHSLDEIDEYGQSGFQGVADALQPRGVSETEIGVSLYVRNTNNVDQAVAYFLGWLAAEERALDDGQLLASIVMVPTAQPASAFVEGVTRELARIAAGDDPVADLSAEQVQALRDREPQVLYSSVSFVDANELSIDLAARDPGLCEGVIVTQVVPLYTSNAGGVIEYRDQLAAYDETAEPGFVSLEGYLAARLFVEGLLEARDDLDTESLVDAMNRLQGIEFSIGTTLEFTVDDHQASDKVWGTILDDACAFESIEL